MMVIDSWIPVDVRLPEAQHLDNWERVLVTTEVGAVGAMIFDLQDQEFKSLTGLEVLAWAPLPNPYSPPYTYSL
jgi:hypothetical protein